MSEEKAKLETAKRLYNEYWAPGDLDRVDEVLDPAIVWTAIESAPDAGTRRGYDECRAYMKEWLDDFVLEPPEINEVGSTPAGDLVCSFAGFATGRASGVRTEIRFAITVRFADDGRIVAIHEYATLPEALEAAGLSE
jgi:ketosteroid isomerase-like protein